MDNPNPFMGGTVVFTVTVTNDGPDNATGVTVGRPAAAGLTYVFDDGGGAYNDGSGIWTIGGIPVGPNISLTIGATADFTGTRTNIAQVTASDQVDPDSSPNNDDGDQSEDDEDNAAVTVASPPGSARALRRMRSPAAGSAP